MAAKWWMLGDLLGIETVENIKEEHRNMPELCCREIFVRWIRGEGVQPCTWQKLIELIEDVGHKALANDLKNLAL